MCDDVRVQNGYDRTRLAALKGCQERIAEFSYRRFSLYFHYVSEANKKAHLVTFIPKSNWKVISGFGCASER